MSTGSSFPKNSFILLPLSLAICTTARLWSMKLTFRSGPHSRVKGIRFRSSGDRTLFSSAVSQTLAVWGTPRGEYLILPLLGPSSYRGIPGEIVDAASSPVSYAIWPIQILDLLNERANAEQSLKFIDEAAVDPYIFMRASYIQWRDYQITEGANTAENLLMPELDESLDDEAMELSEQDLRIKL